MAVALIQCRKEKERNRFECTIYIVPLSCRKAVYVFISTSNITKLFDIDNSYSFDYQKNSYIFKREYGRDCGGVSTPGHGQGEGPDGDKWSKTTQETLGGAGVSEANGVLRNHYHPPS